MIGLETGYWMRASMAGTPGGPGSAPSLHAAQLAAHVQDDLVFDMGAAFGRSAARIAFAGTTDAPDGAVIEGRTVYQSDGVEHSAWTSIGAASGGAFSGSLSVARPSGARAGSWLLREVRVAGSSAAPARSTKRCGVGHVVAVMGQSEPRRTFLTDSGKVYGGALPASRAQVVTGFPRDSGGSIIGGGDTIASFTSSRAFMEVAGQNPASAMTHAADIFTKNSDDLVVFIDMTIPGTSRSHLSNDGAPFDPTDRRRWQDMLAVLDTAGWQDGVRPGLIVDMWTNADGSYAWDFHRVFKPFYTGLNLDGSTYALGTDITVTEFGTGTSVTHRHDHCLFDLSGGGRGLFDQNETRIALCQHRYDVAEKDRQNWLYFSDGLVDRQMWAQEVLRTVQFPAMLADAHLSQIMVRGTEPINYENGTLVPPLAASDLIHPGQGADGLPLYARHIGHAALNGLALAGTTIPQFDGASFDPGGTWAEFSCSAGPVTTERRLRGLAEPNPAPGAHWTDVLGFEFNGQPVERAEIQPNGNVRVYVPAGAGRGAGGIADWAQDRFFFGRGGATGTLPLDEDFVARGWLNYPVVNAAALGLSGAYDDQDHTAGGVSLRPMPSESVMTPASYRAAALRLPAGASFESPAGPGAGVTQLRIDMTVALNRVETSGVYLFGQQNHVYVTINRNGGFRLLVAGGGLTDVNRSGALVPGVRHDLRLTANYATRSAQFSVDGQVVIDHTITGAATAFNGGRRLCILGNTGTTFETGNLDFVEARVWLNDNAAASAPHKTLLASDGAAALNTDAWKRGPDI